MRLTLLAFCFAVSWSLTLLILWGARRWRWLDEPNRRSSHTRPTPTLGGLAILAATILGGWLWPLSPAVLRPLCAAAAVLLLLAIDDMNHPLSVLAKTAIQLGAAGTWIALVPPLTIAVPVFGPIDGAALNLFAVLWLTGWMNVFNFMDGIDAISGTQSIVAGVSLAALLAGVDASLSALPALLAAAAAGFLIFNLPPARLFMGDVGAAFLGLCFGAIALQGTAAGVTLWLAALPLAGYLYDTGLTLLRRALRGEAILEAHRQHLYQRLVRRGWPHGRVAAVTGIVAALFGGAGVHFLNGRMVTGLLLVLPALALLIAGSIRTWDDDDI